MDNKQLPSTREDATSGVADDISEEREDVLDESILNSEDNDINELPLGDAILVSDSHSITAKEISKLIVLVGPSGSGKTTLITAIYQLFQNGTVDEYYFAGSETLLAFEQRAYLTRIRSGQLVPDTLKTRRGVSELLHLKIWNSITNRFCNLLLSDFSGEDFTNVIANTHYAKSDFDVVKGAQHFVIILDGELISKIDQRQSALKDSVELFRTFADADLFAHFVNITVIISKYDIVKKRYEEDQILSNFEEHIKVQFDSIAEPLGKKIYYAHVTVMSDNDVDLNSEQSLINTFKILMDDSSSKKKCIHNVHRALKSQFNCFSEREMVII